MADFSQDISQVLFTESEIKQRVSELALEVSEEYKNKNMLAVCILKGACVFYVDFCRALSCSVQMDFMSISSYGDSTRSSGVVKIMKDIDASITGRNVLIIEDIVDTGLTLRYLLDLLDARKPASIKVAALLNKSEKSKKNFSPDYAGFAISDDFVVGYGLDYAERYRNMPYIGILKREIYEK